MSQPDPVAAYGRARRLASRYCFGVNQHLERISTFDPDREWSELQNKNDWEVVIIFLMRLRRCISFVSRFTEFKQIGKVSAAAFDACLPSLKDLRDFEEHFDDYSMGRGKNAAFDWGQLETYSYGAERFESGVGSIGTSDAKKAALLAWGLIVDLEPRAKALGYLSWDDRFGGKSASGESK